VSENHLDVTDAAEAASSIDRARYWFEQYRYAASWEARLIRTIQELTADHAASSRGTPHAKGSV
jgi:hypothetical protein